MSDTNSNQPAFPLGIPATAGNDSYTTDGLTKREYFAAKAMQGLMGAGYIKLHIDELGKDSGYTNLKMVADMSVQIADALLKQLDK